MPKFTTISLGLVSLFASAALADTPSGPTPAQQLVEQAARNLARQTSVEAKLRQRVELFGKFLVGNGSYRQWTVNDDLQMFRLEMRLQVTDRLTSLLEVSDGTTLWIRRDYGGDRQSLAYVNLDRIRAAAVDPRGSGLVEKRSSAPGNLSVGQGILGAPAHNLALGGLHQLLAGLSASFDFSPPVAAQIGEQPVWQLTGHWKPKMLSLLNSDSQTAAARGGRVVLAKLPQHLPTVVVLALGRDNQLPLFPYRIEYGRLNQTTASASVGSSSADASYEPIATMELFEVRHYVKMNPRDFIFQPGDEPVENHTGLFLKRLGLEIEDE